MARRGRIRGGYGFLRTAALVAGYYTLGRALYEALQSRRAQRLLRSGRRGVRRTEKAVRKRGLTGALRHEVERRTGLD